MRKTIVWTSAVALVWLLAWKTISWCWLLADTERATCFTEANTVSAAISAVATTLALLAAGIGAVAAMGQLREIRREARQRQASQVSAWLPGPKFTGEGPMVLNASGGPVYSVQITVQDSPNTAIAFHIVVLPPTPEPKHSVRDLSATGPIILMRGLPLQVMPGTGPQVCKIEFVDAQGCGWVRDGFGRLKEADPKDHMWADIEQEVPLDGLPKQARIRRWLISYLQIQNMKLAQKNEQRRAERQAKDGTPDSAASAPETPSEATDENPTP